VKALNFTKNKVLKFINSVKADFSFTGINLSTNVPEKKRQTNARSMDETRGIIYLG